MFLICSHDTDLCEGHWNYIWNYYSNMSVERAVQEAGLVTTMLGICLTAPGTGAPAGIVAGLLGLAIALVRVGYYNREDEACPCMEE